MLPSSSAVSQETAALPSRPDVCKITGKVLGMRRKVDNPWPGTPTAFAKTFTEIVIRIDSSEIHERVHSSPDGVSRCEKIAKGDQRSYKLCTHARIKRGDYIQGVEGGAVIGGKSYCLFDLEVLPPT